MRVGAIQLNSTEDIDRNLATADRLVRQAAALGRRAGRRCRRSGPCSARASTWRPAPRRSTGRRSPGRARSPPSSGIDLVAGSIVRARGRPREGRQHQRPRRPRRRDARPCTARSTCSTSRSTAPCTPSPTTEAAGRRDRRLRARGRGQARDERLLRPALPGAVPDPGAARRRGDRGAERVHAADHARPLGGAGARAGDREPVLRDRAQPDRRPSGRPPLRRALADRRPVGAGAGRRARHRDGDRRRARLLGRWRDVRRRLPRSTHRRPEAYGWDAT